MSNNWFVKLILGLMVAAVAACTPVYEQGAALPPTPTPERLTLFVGSEQVECEGAGQQSCLQVKFDSAADWELFYDQIEGFTYEPGFEYELIVERSEVANPPADGSGFQYKLVEVLGKTAAAPETTADSQLVDQLWQWEQFEDGAGENNIVVDNPTRYTLLFLTDGSYQIQADCNGGSGSYTAEGGSLTIEPGVMTLVGCAPDSLDSEFLSKLGEVATYVFDGEKLVLNLKMDAGNMVFAPAAEVTLEGTNWTLNGILVGGDAMTTSSVDGKITALFQDGKLTGSAGCNNYFADYTIEGNTLSIGPISSTKMACDEETNQREAQFLTAMADAGSFTVQQNELIINHKDGDYQLLVFRGQPAPTQ